MLPGSKEQNYLLRPNRGLVMMTRPNRHPNVPYYGLKFIALGKSTQDFFCASSEVVLFKAEL